MANTRDKGLYPQASDVTFAEKWTSQTQTENNGGVVSGNPVIANGVCTFDGTGDAVTYEPFYTTINTLIFKVFLNSEVTGASSFNVMGSFESTDSSFMGFGNVSGGLTNETFTIWDTLASSVTFIKDTLTAGWHTIGLVWNGTSYNFYVDGVAKTTYSGTTHCDQITSGRLQFGKRAAAYFTGGMGTVITSDRAYTAQEMLDDYNDATYSYINNELLNLQMNDKTGTDPYYTSDLSGNGHTATYGDGGSPTTYPTKATGDNYNTYDGGDYLTVPDTRALDITGQMTVTAWCRPTATNGNCSIIARPGTGDRKWLIFQSTGTSNFYFYVQCDGGLSNAGPIALPQNKWSFVTVTYDRTLSSGRLNIYLDDGKVNATANGLDEDVSSQVGHALHVGKYLSNFRGDIGPVKTWKFPLTKTQRLNEYYKGRKYLGV